MRHLYMFCALAALVVAGSPAAARAATILYDGSLNTLPDAQGWSWLASGPGAAHTATSGAVALDTTATRTEVAGFFNHNLLTGAAILPQAPTLDRSAGYELRFRLQVVSEGHNARDDNSDGLDDRAGFSVIAVGNDLWGLELAFFDDRIWAYADGASDAADWFTQAEGVDYDTTAAMRNYDLRVVGSQYQLFADGAPILSGDLRNYASYNVFPDPYDKANMIFFGDDTGSADASVRVALVQYAAVPEPAAAMLALVSLMSVGTVTAARRRRRRNSADARAE